VSDQPEAPKRPSLLAGPPTVINIGLDRFATDLAQAGVAVTQVAWQPPARGNAKLAALLAKLGS
jgi:FdrA protein